MRTVLLIIIIISAQPVFAGSAGDDGAPPVGGGGGGGGGGSPEFFDYYIPLVFNSSHVDGASSVVVWTYQSSTIITSFAQDGAGSSVSDVEGVSRLEFTPDENQGLTNGSLIRSTAPILVIGQRASEDLYKDKSFAYSILPDRMMGFEFRTIMDGYVSIMSSQAATTLHIVRPSDPNEELRTIAVPFQPIQIEVERGTYINGSGPLSGAFISFIDGTQASMLVPQYLKGDNYLLNGDVGRVNENEIDRSYLTIYPSQPTELSFIYKDGSVRNVTIFEPEKFRISSELRGINSSRGHLDVTLNYVYDYGGLQRRSLVHLFAGSEMRAGELFIAPQGYSSDFIFPQSVTSSEVISYNATHPYYPGYILETRELTNSSKYDAFNVPSVHDDKIILTNDSVFSTVRLPGKISHPMDASLAFVNIPLNGQSQKNITGLDSTWYRFPNLSTGNVTVIPGPIEEFTGQVIQVELLSNGSLPASHFKVVITIDDEDPIEMEFDFIPAETSRIFQFERFMEYGKTKINVTVTVDVDNDVNEVNEDDNYREGNFNVLENIRLRGSVLLFLFFVVIYVIVLIRRYLQTRQKISRAHVDVLITEEVVE